MDRTIETPRLLLRPLTLDDASAAFLWTSDPLVNRYMPYPLHQSVQQTADWIAALGERNDFGYVLKETGELIGVGSVNYKENIGMVELGYNLARAYWGKGYATEAARAMLAWAHDFLGVCDFYARHAAANTASGRVLRKCGFQLIGPTQYSRTDGSEVYDALCYTLHVNKEDVLFLDAADLRTSEVMLRLDRTSPAQPEKRWLPAYYFTICLPDGTPIGYCDLRVGHNDKTYIGGNIGYGIDAAYRGRRYAAKACALLFQLARRHGLQHVFITCLPENTASSRTCQLAGGQLLEIADIPEDNEMYAEGKRRVMIYRFDLT